HQGIPAATSSAGDPPLERNPASIPPAIQQENHSIDGVFTQPGSQADIAARRKSGQHYLLKQTSQISKYPS
ncbi:hypothetical protein, partial [Bradyrhizobium sp. SSUT77]|uniref:hypothetical protein n=1 Tax=Bradyrhizobium sp. SSUT77 TaxID=3040603 RepID=UPI00244BBB6A